MKIAKNLFVVSVSCLILAPAAQAAITTTPIGITATFLTVDPTVISIAPLGTATVGAQGSNFIFYENGALFVGFGGTVPVGTAIDSFSSFGPGMVGNFSSSSPSGQYYLPFTQESESDGPFLEAFGYLTFNYDNSTQTISLVSSTVQDDSSGTLPVVATVPEPSGAILLGVAAVALGLRRSRSRA